MSRQRGIPGILNDPERTRILMHMLAQPLTTFTEISHRLGVTRERIRQLAKLRGMTGRARAAARALSKERERVQTHESRLLTLRREVWSVAQRHGFSVEDVWAQPSHTKRILFRILLINGIRCWLRASDGFFPSKRMPNYSLVRVGASVRAKAAVALIRDAWGRFWVIPMRQLKPLVYLPRVPALPTHGSPSRWLPYFERWDLFKKGSSK